LTIVVLPSLQQSFGEEIVLNPYIPWDCPPTDDPTAPAPTIDRDGDNKTDRLYLHVMDKTGNDLEIWCLDHGGGGDFAAYISFPNGTSKYLDKCEFYCGKNYWSIFVNGTDELDQNKTSLQKFTVNGTIIRENHHNWVPADNLRSRDRARDYHSFFDPGSKNYTRIDTIINPTNNTERIIKTTTRTLSSYIPESHDTDSYFVASGVPKDIVSLPSYLAIGSTKIGWNVNGQEKTFEIWYPQMIGINTVVFNEESKSLILTLNSNHTDYMNLSIPKGLLDHPDGGMFQVTVDEKPVLQNETVTFTHRTLYFAIPSDAKMVTINGVTAAPEFGPIAILMIFIAMIGVVTSSKFRNRS
jgi:hypothetical protein